MSVVPRTGVSCDLFGCPLVVELELLPTEYVLLTPCHPVDVNPYAFAFASGEPIHAYNLSPVAVWLCVLLPPVVVNV